MTTDHISQLTIWSVSLLQVALPCRGAVTWASCLLFSPPSSSPSVTAVCGSCVTQRVLTRSRPVSPVLLGGCSHGPSWPRGLFGGPGGPAAPLAFSGHLLRVAHAGAPCVPVRPASQGALLLWGRLRRRGWGGRHSRPSAFKSQRTATSGPSPARLLTCPLPRVRVPWWQHLVAALIPTTDNSDVPAVWISAKGLVPSLVP